MRKYGGVLGRSIAWLLAVLVMSISLAGCTGEGAFSPPDKTGIPSVASESTSPLSVSDIPSASSDVNGAMDPLQETDLIRINQVGYRPAEAKKAVVVTTAGNAFSLVPAFGGPPVHTGVLSHPVHDDEMDETLSYADFTAFVTPGDYRLQVEDVGCSPPFRIAEDVYVDLDRAVLKFFYYQRCGMDLEAAHAEDWTHGACHLDAGVLPESTEKAGAAGDGTDRLQQVATGGWHDAGDYGRYVVTGAVSVADLLLAWELSPDAFADDTGIPESGNGIPDVLDECRYELDWLLRMQDPTSGGVYHKLTTANFPAMLLMPDAERTTLLFSPMSSTATADFAAVMAMAARVYGPLDAAFAADCLTAAENAWAWLEAYEGVPGFTNPPGMHTGEYGDHKDSDERYWAAAELLRTTGQARYADTVRHALEGGGISLTALGWQETGGFGTIACLFAGTDALDAQLLETAREAVLSRAEEIRVLTEKDPYGASLLPSEYGWGSNSALANNAMLLLLAHRLQPDDAWLDAAGACREVLLGRNVLGQCHVTGFGSKTVLRPHHRPSAADRVKAPVPGMLAGGPNGYLQDPAAQAACTGLPPAACYVDDVGSYSTNEVAINWNAPLVFVFAGLQEQGLH